MFGGNAYLGGSNKEILKTLWPQLDLTDFNNYRGKRLQCINLFLNTTLIYIPAIKELERLLDTFLVINPQDQEAQSWLEQTTLLLESIKFAQKFSTYCKKKSITLNNKIDEHLKFSSNTLDSGAISNFLYQPLKDLQLIIEELLECFNLAESKTSGWKDINSNAVIFFQTFNKKLEEIKKNDKNNDNHQAKGCDLVVENNNVDNDLNKGHEDDFAWGYEGKNPFN